MPRVLQVVEATIGGVRRHLRELSLGIREHGWQVDIACAQARDPGFADDLAQFRERDIGVYPVAMLRRPAPLADAAAVHRLAALMRRLKPDLVHAHSTKAGLLARLAARRLGIPVCYTPHCFAFAMRTKRPLRWLYREMERRLVPLTACLIAVSRAEQAAARALGFPPERVRYIPNGIPPVPASALSSDERPYDVAFIGRFCRQKGIDLMIEALMRLAKRHPDLRVGVMGGGSSQIAHRLATLPQVQSFPFGGTDAVERLLRQSRILAMPSRWEGLPYLLLEAMSVDTTVAAADVGGVTDVVTDGQDAFLFRPDSSTALEQALDRLLEDEPRRRRLTEAARERVRAFSLEGMIASTRACYEDFRQNVGRIAEIRSAQSL